MDDTMATNFTASIDSFPIFTTLQSPCPIGQAGIPAGILGCLRRSPTPAPVLFVNRSGALLHANTAGSEALRRADYLVLRHGLVQPRTAGP